MKRQSSSISMDLLDQLDQIDGLDDLVELSNRAKNAEFKLVCNSAKIWTKVDDWALDVDFTFSGNIDSSATVIEFGQFLFSTDFITAFVGKSRHLKIKLNAGDHKELDLKFVSDWFLENLPRYSHLETMTVIYKDGTEYSLRKGHTMATIHDDTKVSSDNVSILFVKQLSHMNRYFDWSSDEEDGANEDGTDEEGGVNEKETTTHIKQDIRLLAWPSVNKDPNEIVHDFSELPDLEHLHFAYLGRLQGDLLCILADDHLRSIFHPSVTSLKSVYIKGPSLYGFVVLRSIVDAGIESINSLEICISSVNLTFTQCNVLNLLPKLKIKTLKLHIESENFDRNEKVATLKFVRQLTEMVGSIVGLRHLQVKTEHTPHDGHYHKLANFHELFNLPLRSIVWDTFVPEPCVNISMAIEENEMLTHCDLGYYELYARIHMMSAKGLMVELKNVIDQNKKRNLRLINAAISHVDAFVIKITEINDGGDANFDGGFTHD